MATAEYKRLLTEAYDLDKPEAPPEELFENGVLVETELDEWVCRYWEPAEVRGLLEDAGFVSVRATKAFTSLPLDSDETMVSFLAVKPGRTSLA